MLRNELEELLHEIIKLNQKIIDTGKYKNLISLCEQDISILHLISNNREINAKEISDILLAPKTTIVSAVDRLSKRGYIIKTPDNFDKRRINLALSDLGKHAVWEHDTYEEQLIEYLINKWDESDQQELASIISRRKKD